MHNYWCYLFLISAILVTVNYCAIDSDSRQIYRIKRDGDLLGSLGEVIQQLKETLLGPPKPGALSDAFVPNSRLPAEYRGPTILQAVGFCKMNFVDCDFVGCLATNFKESKMAQGIKKGGKVLLDPPLRRALLEDPNIMKAACQTQNLEEFMCNAFKQFLGLFDRIDPPSAHVHDEPRDKRSAELLPVRRDALPVVAVNPAPGTVVVVRNRPSEFLPPPIAAPPRSSVQQNLQPNVAVQQNVQPNVPVQQNVQPNVPAQPPRSAAPLANSAQQPAPPRGNGFPPQPGNGKSKEAGNNGVKHLSNNDDYSVAGGNSNKGGGNNGGDHGNNHGNHGGSSEHHGSDYDYNTSGGNKGGSNGGGNGNKGGNHGGGGGKPGQSDYDYNGSEGHGSGGGGSSLIGEGPQRNCIAERQSAVQQRDNVRTG